MRHYDEEMGMPLLQKRRFRHNAGDIPNVGGLEQIARLGTEMVAASQPNMQVEVRASSVLLFIHICPPLSSGLGVCGFVPLVITHP